MSKISDFSQKSDWFWTVNSRGELDNETASMFKLYATEKYVSCVNKLLQHWGGWGYMWEYDIAKEYAGARVFTIYAGTSEIMKELISRDVYPRKWKIK